MPGMWGQKRPNRKEAAASQPILGQSHRRASLADGAPMGGWDALTWTRSVSISKDIPGTPGSL